MTQKHLNPKTINTIQNAAQLLTRANYAQAEELLVKIVQKKNAPHQALHLYAICQIQQGKPKAAIKPYQCALQQQPHNIDYLTNLGLAYSQLEEYKKAINYLQQALTIDEKCLEARFNLANCLARDWQLDAAIMELQQIIEQAPNLLDAYSDLATCYILQSRYDDAEKKLLESINISDQQVNAPVGLSNTYRKTLKLELAEKYIEQALALDPNSKAALTSRADLYREQRKPHEAQHYYQKALSVDPDFAEAHWSLGTTSLLIGDFKKGWEEIEWRWQVKELNTKPRGFPQPLWQGEDLHNKSILIHTEQGIGDNIQLLRYLPLVRKKGGKIILECQIQLIPLLSNSIDFDEVYAKGEQLPDFDVHLPTMSLPGIFNTCLDTIPPASYLTTPKKFQEKWRNKIPNHNKRRVGLTWAGSPGYKSDFKRSCHFNEIKPLLALNDIDFYCLQKGPQLEQIDGDYENLTILDEQLENFADTAAVIEQLDLVISVDTSVAHLAGTLGKRCWVMLPYIPDWRWLLDREDSPWYPSLKLYRQDEQRCWENVIMRIQHDLKHL